MKRLVFCFDGTWNRLDSPHPTNVVIAAESVLPFSNEGVAQAIFYDDGVGTGEHEHFSGGIFGTGLVKNLGDGYRFLIFNYTPGDQIYVFGFSRGAYTARSFVGLLNTCGILLRKEAARVNEGIALYKQREASDAFREKMMRFRRDYSPAICLSDAEHEWRLTNIAGYAQSPAPRLRVEYVGVWDTVGALGIPIRYAYLGWFNEKHQFHDTSLSAFVKSARHAVAIDERRLDFRPTLWDNLDSLNEAAGKQSADVDAPYQQQWFPGVHSSVGGGGERRGLSDLALEWVLDGARAAGLTLDGGAHSRIFELSPNYQEHLENSEDPGLLYRVMNRIAGADRLPGPQSLHEVSIAAKRRWLEKAESLKDKVRYRPKTLDAVAPLLKDLTPEEFGLGDAGVSAPDIIDTYEVKRGDTLGRVAKKAYGAANEWQPIFEANRDKIDDPNRIYPGMLLRIPRRRGERRE
jgi:uncharacterized protein (DUF2235 family)